MSTMARWDAPEYQRIRSARYDAGWLAVWFEDGAEVTVGADRVLPPHVREADWAKALAPVVAERDAADRLR